MTSDLRPDMARPTNSLGDGFAEASWVASTAEAATAPDRPGKRPDFDLAYQFAARHLATEFHTAAVIDHDKHGLYAARVLVDVGFAGGPDDIIRRVV